LEGWTRRQFIFPNGPTNLPLVFFNNISNLNNLVTNQVTFQVNMTAQTALGLFTPGSDYVTVAGSAFDDWDDLLTYVLTNSSANTNLYINTFPVSDLPGGSVSYKFLIDGATYELDVPDRTFNEPTNSALALPLVFFDGVSDLGTVQIGPVTGSQVALSWGSATNANNRIRLQSISDLTAGAWQDVPGTFGASNASVTVGSGQAFFRLKGP